MSYLRMKRAIVFGAALASAYALPVMAETAAPAAATAPKPAVAAPAGATAKPLSAYLTAPASTAKAPPAATQPVTAQPVKVAPATNAAAPVSTKPATAPTQPAIAAVAVTPAPAVAANAVQGTVTPVLGPDGLPLPPAPPVITPEERHKQELLANAESIDKVNRELLAEKQKMTLQLEQLETQVNVLKNDRSNEGIRNGALAVIAGFLLGWFFASSRKSRW